MMTSYEGLDEFVPPEVQEMVPRKGLVYAHIGTSPLSGFIIVDQETKEIVYKVHNWDKAYDDSKPLTDDEFDHISEQAHLILHENKSFHGDLQARVQFIYLVIADPPLKKEMEFPGQILDEVEDLRNYLIGLLPMD